MFKAESFNQLTWLWIEWVKINSLSSVNVDFNTIDRCDLIKARIRWCLKTERQLNKITTWT